MQPTSPQPKKLLDLGEMMLRGELPPPPLTTLLGFHLISIGSGQAVFEYEANESHANPMGTLHGGILCTVADSAMGMAYASLLEAGESFTTLEMKINFLKPVWQTRLRAVGRVIKNGRTIGLVECDIMDEKDQLIAHATSTCMTLRGDQAQGR